MLKQKIKDYVAKIMQKCVAFCVKKGCLKQDDLVYKFSHYERVQSDVGDLVFFCPGEIPSWRAKTFFTKEPETLSWINLFKSNETFLDVGANVGLYTIYASKKGHKVWAIEPLAENYFILQRNIFINKLQNVKAFCACLYNENKIDSLKVRNSGFGQATNSFHESVGAYDEIYHWEYEQGVVAFTLDYFSEKMGVPNHVKIDVDGHELKILEGSKATLSNSNLKSVLIEMNEESAKFNGILRLMSDHGFEVTEKSHSEMMNNAKYHMFKNYIFMRKG